MNTRKLFVAAAAMTMLGGAAARAQDNSSDTMKQDDTAQQEPTRKMSSEKATSLPESEQRNLTLVVKHVDKANHKVLFEAQVSPEASILEKGRTIKLDQLKPGDSVRASFDPQTGELIKIEVTRVGGMKKTMK